MPRVTPSVANTLLVGWAVLVPFGDAGHSDGQAPDRSALIAALERLMATGEPQHTTHDDGQRLQLALDEAIAHGDREVERLAIRAASPLTASIDRPVASIHEPPSITFDATTVLGVKRAVPYTARLFASLDGGAYEQVAEVRSGKSVGRRIDALGLEEPVRPGLHVVRVRAELTFDATAGRTRPRIERRVLPPLSYAVFDPADQSSAPVQALVYGPASIPVREFDPQLGAEPLAAWLSGVISNRRSSGDSKPAWMSRYCHERTGEAGSRQRPTAICSVVYFSSHAGTGQLWFRTAEIRETETGVEWTPTAPARFEGLGLPDSGQMSEQLSALPSLIDAPPESRLVGDISISSSDIVVVPSATNPGASQDVTVTVRNVGLGALLKVGVNVVWGFDPQARGTSREFVVDIPAQSSTDLTLQVAFPTRHGYVMAHAMLVSAHAPPEWWSRDPTPFDACAIRIVNKHLAPAGFGNAISDATGCQRVQ
jgi:hypothetical protein